MIAQRDDVPVISLSRALMRRYFRRKHHALEFFPQRAPVKNEVFARLEIVFSPARNTLVLAPFKAIYIFKKKEKRTHFVSVRNILSNLSAALESIPGAKHSI